MKVFMVRALLVIGLPFCIAWAVIARLLSETKNDFHLAYLDARIEIEAFERTFGDVINRLDHPHGKKGDGHA